MKALTLPLIYFLALLLGTAEATAQSHTQTHPFSPLRQFLQQDSDTTIVFQYTTNWIGPSALYAYFLSKKGDRLQLHATAISYGVARQIVFQISSNWGHGMRSSSFLKAAIGILIRYGYRQRSLSYFGRI